MSGGAGSNGAEDAGGAGGFLHGRHPLGPREFERLRRLIYVEAGIALSPAKRVLLESRLAKRLRALGLDSFEDYCTYLDEHRGEELVAFINCVTTNKTDFFREPHHFAFLRDHVLPAADMRARQTGERRLRFWSAGCSTGEEPYTIAMLLREWQKGHPGWDVRILASDIDTAVLAAAAAGEYDADRLEAVAPEWRERWFVPASGGSSGRDDGRGDGRGDRLRAVQSLRELIAFRRINLNDEPWPIHATFDVIFCRNVIIYFDRDTQSRLLTRFARLLKPDGHLIIGHSESLAWLSDTFTSVRGVPTVYRLAARAAGKAPLPKPLSQGEGLGFSVESPRDSVCSSAPARPRLALSGPRFAPASPRFCRPPLAPPPATPTVLAGTTAPTASAGTTTQVAFTGTTAQTAFAGTPTQPAFAGTAARTEFAGTAAQTALAGTTTQAAFAGSAGRRLRDGVPRGLTEKGGPLSLGEGDGGVGPFHAVIGAEVLVGLFDEVVAVGGAAVVPSNTSASSLLTSLMRQLETRGALAERLRAKVFGGAALPGADAAAAALTVDAVHAALAAVNVPIAAERTGGAAPLEILFHADTGRALVREAPAAVWRAQGEAS